MLRTILVLGILSIGLPAALFSRYVALLLYIWFALFRPQEWVYFDLSAYRLSLVLGIVLVVPSILAARFPKVTHPVAVGTLVFLGSALLAQTGAVRPDIGWAWLAYMGELALVCLLVPVLATTRTQLLGVVATIGMSFGFHAAKAGLMSLFSGGARFGDGFAGAFVDNNGYAVGIVMILPLLVITAQNSSHRLMRIALFTWVPLSAFAAVSTFSRGGFLALIASLCTWMLLQRRRFRIIIAAAAVVGIGAAIVPIPEGYGDRLKTIQTYEHIGETSALSRLYFWRVALEMSADYPFGIGLRNFEALYDKYDSTDGEFGSQRSVHNSHLQVLSETGVLGAFAWIAVFGFAFRAVSRARRASTDLSLSADDQRFLFTTANGVCASLVGFIVGGNFIAMALNDLTWLVLATAMSLDLYVARALAAPRAAVPAAPAVLSVDAFAMAGASAELR